MEPYLKRDADGRCRIVIRTPCVRNRRSGSAQAAQCGRLSRSSIAVRSHSDRWWSPMVARSACLGCRGVVVSASHWRRGRSGNAIGLTKVAHLSTARSSLQSHRGTWKSDIRRPHGDLVDSLGRHGRSVVAVPCDWGFKKCFGND